MRYLFVLVLLTGCRGADLKPTVRKLESTLVFLRRDYAEGRVTFSDNAVLQTGSRLRRLRLIDEAIRNARTARGAK